jgi:hypothetical protein
MRFYIIKQAISLLLVSSAVALRGGNVRSSQLVPDADLTGVIDIGILSSTTGADADHQYEVDGQNDHTLTAGLEEVSTYVGEVEDGKTHDNEYTPSLDMTEGVRCVALSFDCKICYTYRSYYFLGNCCCGQSTSK